MGQVYVVTNTVNGMQYVGQTLTTGAKRLKQMSTNMLSTNLLRLAIHEYGVEVFTVKVLEEATDRQTLLAREYYWIGQLNTLAPNGYNQARFIPGSTKERIPRALAKATSKRSKLRLEASKRRDERKLQREIISLREELKLEVKEDNRIILVEGHVYKDVNDPELIRVLRTVGNDWWGALTPKERLEYKWKLLDSLRSEQVPIEGESDA